MDLRLKYLRDAKENNSQVLIQTFNGYSFTNCLITTITDTEIVFRAALSQATQMRLVEVVLALSSIELVGISNVELPYSLEEEIY